MDRFTKTVAKVSSKKSEWYDILDVANEVYYSNFFEISRLQESIRYRSRHYAARLASYLINEEGEFREDRLTQVLNFLRKGPYVVGPDRESDSLIFLHFLHVLTAFKENPELIQALKKFRLPLCHKKAEEIIKISQQKKEITNTDLRRSVLSLCLTPLRQIIGSCFATAPAILIQKNQLSSLLKDLSDLLHTGRLTRVIAGREYTVPMNISFGMGDLLKPIRFYNPELLSYSPGLVFALVDVGLIPKEDTFQIKQKKCLKMILPFWDKEPRNVSELLRWILLDKFSLTEEALQAEKERDKTKILAENLHPFAYLSAYSSVKEKKIQEFYKLFESALATFRTLIDHPLLKVWEFTLASLSDIKLSFTRWNLYISLGLDHKVPSGLGQFLYEIVEKKLAEANRQVAENQTRHERAYDVVRMSESMLRTETSEARIYSLQAERQTSLHEMQSSLMMRDLAYKKAGHYANLYSSLLEKYYELFQEYFQELYDPEIQILGDEAYSDSPAGFRLVYKHGRRDPSAWTSIQSGDEYISSLRDFFHQTEHRIVSSFPPEMKDEISEVITEVTLFIQSPFFLEEAIKRMKADEKEEPAKASLRKPWSYPSGGTMETLLKTYYRLEEIHKERVLLKGQIEPLAFYYHALQSLSPSQEFLTYSPSHAFIFLPILLQASLQGDSLEERSLQWKKFYAMCALDIPKQKALLEELISYLPSKEGAFKTLFPQGVDLMEIGEFYQVVTSCLKRTYQKSFPKIAWDKLVSTFLFQSLPLQSKEAAEENAAKIFLSLGLSSIRLMKTFRELISEEFVSLDTWLKTCFASLLSDQEEFFYNKDIVSRFIQEGRKMRLLSPSPLLFADTNWPSLFFGWIVNFDGQWELWALDRTGTKGFPMTDWKMYLEDNAFEWGIYTNPQEYSDNH